MWYVEVIVASATYHKDAALTYSSAARLEPGALVQVPLQRKTVPGVVVRGVQKPDFKVKPIAQALAIPHLPEPSLLLLQWMREYYPAPLGIIAQLFLPKMPPKPSGDLRKPQAVHLPPKFPPLTADQKTALAAITQPGLHILHGDTGTGKTRVYIELAKRASEAQQSSIIVTPEIALTPQLANDFRQVFGERVYVIHSGLGEAARRDIWYHLLQSPDSAIIIGARSALFYPVKNVGLVIVDEAHEPAYKQDQAPYYHATNVAGKLAALHQAPFVLGSASPLVSDYFIAEAKQRPIIRMTQTAAQETGQKKHIEIVDLKDKGQFKKSLFFSDALLDALKANIERGEQSLLFLNRRGTARVVFCEQCGWRAICPHCDLPLIYHGDHHLMRCHSCDFKAASPTSCPECKNTSIIFTSIGTKAIYDDIVKRFPEAKVMRFDADNKKNERLDSHYDAVRNGNVDIIIGTQTLAKGLDLPKLSLVGVLIADTSLYFPDFSAQERTYQLLSQVVGRVGRGHRAGRAIIQTYSPGSFLLQAIISKKWDVFYKHELKERQIFTFPPFCYLLKLTCKRATSENAQKAADDLAHKLRQNYPDAIIEGPAPAFREKSHNKFEWQLIVKSKHRTVLTSMIRTLPSGWSYDIDPINLL